ncbi:CHAT domain-containing protein [Azohydromonas aeria]|uniref:CHAT domain-containing protein n=1 Tax=Azohydromonas aeria TaxID=2590212 RepID=UPI0012FCFE2F|nr:CHAT domain-containing protein [Azohydromonas aeria]
MPSAADPVQTLKLRVRESGLARAPAVQDLRISSALRVEPGGPARDVATAPVEVASDALVRVEYENGMQLWLRADDLVAEQGRMGSTRDAQGGPVWDIEVQPAAGVHADMPAGTRGAAGLAIKALEFFGVDVLKDVSTDLASTVEMRRLQGNEPGLYQCTLRAADPLKPVAPAQQLPADRPVLLFLHGTMSSFRGSFSGIEAESGEAAETARTARQTLARLYGPHIYAFEHRTLTESPITNALALARLLPVGAELHLVSHSRGGLVGELLCLAERDAASDPLDAGTLDRLFAQDRTIAPLLGLPMLGGAEAKARLQAYAQDRERLGALLTLLAEKRIRVRRFVRVACPARGTTLASGRLDRWLSVLDLIAGGALFGGVADFLLGVVKKRTDPRTMPGIEAMMPGSATTRLLTLPGLVTNADLSVIAGNLRGDGRWGQLKLLLVNSFYGAEHDLIVNTGSMSGGIRRPENGARWLQDEGPRVNHFNYFDNARSLDWLVQGLDRGEGQSGGFAPFAQARVEEPRWRAAVQRSKSAGPRPIVVVVPGIMGSQLAAGGSRIWLSYWALLKGGLADIAWTGGNDTVQPLDLVSDYYGPLLEYLARGHRVEVFAYDWRRSVRESAAKLAETLTALVTEAERTKQPLHIVAHSMGGLVARAMIGDGDKGQDLWRRMGRLSTSGRLLMLGTPNRGSHEAVRWLVGTNPTLAKLALLDWTHSREDIIDIVRRFPGMAELLPFDDKEGGYAKQATWRALRETMGERFTLIEQAQLDAAARSAQLLSAKDTVDAQRMLYVAGCQPATVVGWQLAPGVAAPSPRRVQWRASTEGDGTVTWASGRLDGVPMYYAEDTAHDELCANDSDLRIFRGYADLLATGRTDQLGTTPPRAHRAEGVPQEMVLPPLPPADDIPGEESLRGAGFGGMPRRRRQAAMRRTPIEVSVRHMDLAYARHAVLVGHYQGDTVISAEAALDARLDQALTRRRELRLYPGPHGTSAVFFNEVPGRSPSGAVVVGLGMVGELSPGRLEANLRDAMLEYALRLLQRPGAGCGGSRIPARLSCLLVGSGAAGLSLRDCVNALLRAALRANDRLQAAQLDGRVQIEALEIVELYEDMAIGAARALSDVMNRADIRERVRWQPPTLQVGPGGYKRRFQDEDRAWAQRIEIVRDADGQLRFNVATNRARAEETLATGQLSLAEAFVQQASAGADEDEELAHTLFELLLPSGFKEGAPDQRDMVLMLDEYTARFPWELLQDGWNRDGQPLAIAAGMVRQLKLKSGEYRERPSQALGDTALVIGDPDLQASTAFVQLPGARTEAEAVRDALQRVFDPKNVTWLINTQAGQIVKALHQSPWRILHLAGHGVHEMKDEAHEQPMSGMVIGDGVFLTPGDVAQMRCVPELVFINCCHLGRTEIEDAKLRARHFGRMAANLGAQFISMGVRAVVCAGWAVDDAAAVTFARTFYEHLFDGRSFRDAVRNAREAARLKHPRRNTWGAYQCYGDPDWRLLRAQDQGGRQRPPDYVSQRELLADLDNLAGSVRVQLEREGVADDVLGRQVHGAIEALRERIPEPVRKRWLASADVAAAIGFAYGEAMLCEPALEWLEIALKSSKGSCPLSVFEQIINLRARQAANEAEALPRRSAAAASSAAGPTAAAAEMDGGEQDAHVEKLVEIAERIRRVIDELSIVARRAPTVERLSLLGAAYKRLAWVRLWAGLADEQGEALLQMADAYGQALKCSDDDGSYAFTNWAVARLLVDELVPRPLPDGVPQDWRQRLTDLVAEQGQSAQRRQQADPDFWNEAAVADLALVSLLLAGDAAACDKAAQQAIDGYGNAMARGASPRNASSVREHLRFMRDVTASLQTKPAIHAALKRVADTV